MLHAGNLSVRSIIKEIGYAIFFPQAVFARTVLHQTGKKTSWRFVGATRKRIIRVFAAIAPKDDFSARHCIAVVLNVVLKRPAIAVAVIAEVQVAVVIEPHVQVKAPGGYDDVCAGNKKITRQRVYLRAQRPWFIRAVQVLSTCT